MGRIYYAPIDIANAGTDADQDIFMLASGSANKVILHGFEVTSNVTTSTSIKCRVMRRTGAGTGGSAITETASDPDNTVANTASLTTDVETPGTGGDVLMSFQWEQMGPLQFLPTPEMRPILDVSDFLALNLQTNPANAAISGWVCWEEV